MNVTDMTEFSGNRPEAFEAALLASGPEGLVDACDAPGADPYAGSPVMGVGIGSYKLKPQVKDDVETDPDVDIPELFDKMKAQKGQLLAIIDFCREERTSEEVDEMLAPLMKKRLSVYTPILMRDLLMRAGALSYVVEGAEDSAAEEGLACTSDELLETDGEAVVSDADDELVLSFLEVEEAPAGKWASTPAGIAFFEGQHPNAEIDALFDGHAEDVPLFQLILDACAEEPRKTAYLDVLVSEHPLAQDPVRFASYFVGQLEDCGALEWDSAWMTTEAGRAYALKEGQR